MMPSTPRFTTPERLGEGLADGGIQVGGRQADGGGQDADDHAERKDFVHDLHLLAFGRGHQAPGRPAARPQRRADHEQHHQSQDGVDQRGRHLHGALHLIGADQQAAEQDRRPGSVPSGCSPPNSAATMPEKP